MADSERSSRRWHRSNVGSDNIGKRASIQSSGLVNIVIEPFDEWEPASPAAPSHDESERSPGTSAAGQPVRSRPRRGSAPSTAWIAAVAVASELATLVAIPVHTRAESTNRPTTTPSVATERADSGPPTADRLLDSPPLAPACHYLFDVAADALATEPDSYLRVALGVSGAQGRSLNDVVHDDVMLLRDEILRLPLAVPGGSATRVEALDEALGRADASPCPWRETRPGKPGS